VRRTKDEVDEGEQIYTTNEGDVLLSISGTSVFVSEGFPVQLARKLRDSIVSVQSDAPLQVAGSMGSEGPHASGDPGVDLVRLLSSAGVMKAAIRGESGASERYTLVKQ
jgi:hypothetical protein